MENKKETINFNVCRPVNAIDFYNVIGLLLQVFLLEKYVGYASFLYNNLRGLQSFKIPVTGILIAISLFFIFINLSASYLVFKDEDDKKRFRYVSGILANSVILITLAGIIQYILTTII